MKPAVLYRIAGSAYAAIALVGASAIAWLTASGRVQVGVGIAGIVVLVLPCAGAAWVFLRKPRSAPPSFRFGPVAMGAHLGLMLLLNWHVALLLLLPLGVVFFGLAREARAS